MNLDIRYLRWLASVVGTHQNTPEFHILEVLHDQRFIPILDLDWNRAIDGTSLRHRFGLDMDVILPDGFDDPDGTSCTFLEMMVGIADRMALQIDVHTDKAFWRIARNMGIAKDSNPSDELIEMCAQRVVNRSYNYDGTHGGMFPLRDTDRDQRFIHLFSQLQSYIMEMDL